VTTARVTVAARAAAAAAVAPMTDVAVE
ncbi:hypothetical protein Tco_0582344, partial [Tanacetum coccineum]